MALPLVLSLGGTALSVWGSLEEGRLNARQAEANAQTAEWNAKLTRLKAREDERVMRVMARKEIGRMRANFGASGIAIEGSALDVLQESAALAENDALNIRRHGELQATAFEREAGFARAMGSRYRQAGGLGAAAAVLSGAARIAARE